MKSHYPLLKSSKVCRAQGVGLGYYRDQIDSGAQSLHYFNVQRLECMAGRSDEVKASVDSQINLVHSAWLLLLQHVGFVLIVKEFDNG